MGVLDRFQLPDAPFLVTGGEGRLGQQWCLAIREAGGIPISFDLIKKPGSTASATYCLDLCDQGARYLAVADVVRTHGRLRGLVNNAAYNPPPERPECREDWERQFAVLAAHDRLTFEVVERRPSDTPALAIVNIGSDLALMGPNMDLYQTVTPKPAHYTTVKHATVGLTRHYAMLYAKKNVRVNCLCPGPICAVRTGATDSAFVERLKADIPMGRLADLHEYDAALIFLLSDASSFMTGSVLSIARVRTCP